MLTYNWFTYLKTSAILKIFRLKVHLQHIHNTRTFMSHFREKKLISTETNYGREAEERCVYLVGQFLVIFTVHYTVCVILQTVGCFFSA